MKTRVAAIFIAAALWAAPRASAQVIAPPPAPVWAAVPYRVYPYGVYPAVIPLWAVPEYGYPISIAYNVPARYYVGYGTNDFPFYGRPYGHPYEPWSWPYIGGYMYRAYAYYPVLGP
jgi:hypothetical protein